MRIKKVVFGFGGAGNNFFQYQKAAKEKCLYSEFLSKKYFYKLAGWIRHKDKLAQIIDFNKTKTPFLNIFFLFIDLLLVKTLKISLFTEFATKNIVSSPIINLYNYFGYYQIKSITQEFIFEKNNVDKMAVIAHFRGGDFIKHKNTLDIKYYDKCIKLMKNHTTAQMYGITNDPDFFANFKKFGFIDASKSFVADFNTIKRHKFVICSNSTFALIASIQNIEEKIVFVPSELQKLFSKSFLLKYSKNLMFITPENMPR